MRSNAIRQTARTPNATSISIRPQRALTACAAIAPTISRNPKNIVLSSISRSRRAPARARAGPSVE